MFDENLFNIDLKSFIKNNMQGVKDVNKIINKEIVEKPGNIFPLKYDEINQMLNNWKIVSQSKLNIYNEYETHKTNPFIFGLNNSSDVSRPSEENVVEFLYQYAMWFSVGKYISTVRDFQIHLARKLGLSIYKCCNCENDIQVNELECSKCGESLMSCLKKLLVDQPDANLSSECKVEIKKNKENKKIRHDKKNNSQLCRKLNDRFVDVIGGDIGENWNCWWGNCGKRNNGKNQYCAYCGIDRAANQERGALIDALLSGRKEQIWICSGCGLFNKDVNSDKCEVCELFRNAGNENKSAAARDAIVNKSECCAREILSGKCSGCGKLCRGPNARSGDVIGGDIGEHWDCWWRNCGKRNKGNNQCCSYCGIDRAANQKRGALIEALLYRGKQQIWICSGCNHFNWDINGKVCSKCYESRYGLDPIIITVGEKWKCWRELCGNANDGNDKYCTHCGVDKTANQMRGAQINACKEGRKEQIWICSGCGYFNKDLKRVNCEICDGMRYGEDEYDSVSGAEEMLRGAAGELDEWKCSQCECVNNHQLVTCRACGEIKEKLCKICTKPFRVGNEICPGCDDKWQCWFRLCGNMNYGNVDYCKRCGIGKDDNGKYGLPITRWLDGEFEEIWICRTCCFINKGTDDCCRAPRYCNGKRYKVCPHCKYCIEDYCGRCSHCYKWL